MPTQIVEVIRRADQGITRPFICRADDGETYFVKGRSAGRKSLVAEWICGHLGKRLGLPIPSFDIVDIPTEIINAGALLGLDYSDLGAGLAFGSRRCEAMELTSTTAKAVPADLQLDVLAFDWWIRNADRTLTETGGNPNLFWNPEASSLVVIDHNQAFDADFDPASFLDLHVFSTQSAKLFNDMFRRDEYNQRFASALGNWNEIANTIPEEWFFADPEQTVPADFELESMYKTLQRCNHDDFWGTP